MFPMSLHVQIEYRPLYKIYVLGPQKPNLIPVEIYDNSEEINTDTNFVLNEWSNQFNSLFKGYNRNDFDKPFYDFAMG